MGMQHSRDLAPRAGRRLPGAQALTQLAHPTTVADLGHDVIPATEQPIEDLGRPKTAIQAEHNPLAALARPTQVRFDLLEGGFERWHRRRLAPQQGLVENFSVVTGGEPQRFPSGFTPVAPHPGAFTPLGLCPNWQGGDIDIYPQELRLEPMTRGAPIALEVIARHL